MNKVNNIKKSSYATLKENKVKMFVQTLNNCVHVLVILAMLDVRSVHLVQLDLKVRLVQSPVWHLGHK